VPSKPTEQHWREFLEGTDPNLARLKRWFRRLPKAPRCKMCNAPFGPPGSFLVRPFGYRRWPANPALCSICARGLEKSRGGAEIDATFLFADIRGSTAMAERARPAEFHALLERFYAAAAKAIDETGGLVDKYLGDGVVALFVPVFTQGVPPAMAAVYAGHRLLEATGHGTSAAPWLPLGIGVHAGPAFVGVMGTEGGQLDFTGVGDTVNIAARLGSVAQDGELLVSEAAASRARLATTGLERRSLDLKGREEPVDVVVLRGDTPPVMVQA
jgi:class 3 adenylate cyclase